MARKFTTPIDMGGLEILNVLAHLIAGDPGSPQTGEYWFDINGGLFKWYDGTSVIDPLARSNHSGTQLASTISDFDTQVRTNRLDQMAAPTADVGFNGQKITNLGAPSGANDAARLADVQGVSAGLAWKDSVRAATTGPGALATDFENGDTVDGVVLATGDRILIKNQTAGEENGIYTVNATGAPTRATDADSAEDIRQASTFVEEGTTNGDSAWVNTTDAPITLGTTPLVFTQFTGGAGVNAGDGLTKTGSTLDVGAGVGIIANPDDIAIDTGVVVRKYAEAVGDGAATSFVINHALATRDVTVQVYRNSASWDQVECDVEHTDANNVTLRFAVAPTTDQYRVVVHG